MKIRVALTGLWLALNVAALPLSYAAEPDAQVEESLPPASLRGLSTTSETPSPSSTTPAQPFTTPNTSTLYRDLPTITGRYSLGETTLLPYLGAGFGSGYASDLDRSLNGGTSGLGDAGLRNLFGPQNLTPNEVRMGIRIPF